MARILVVDDEKSVRLTLSVLLTRAGHEPIEAASGSEAIALLTAEPPDLVITDLRMGEVDGVEVLKAAKQASSSVEVIVLTAHGTVESAVDAMRLGAYDYMEKPFETEALVYKVANALERRQLVTEMHQLRQAFGDKYSFDNIVAKSAQLQGVLERVARIANTNATVLIEGETGTGKDLVARALHNHSARRDQQFLAINCGALPEHLLESELFGHVRGAFTGANADKRGLFEEADGGTIFLDEISELLPATQVKLLRALQDGEVRRVGSNTAVRVDTRVLAATNQRLRALVKRGRFREDLYYRLNVIRLHIPPLRERRDDIMPLAWHFLRLYNKQHGTDVKGFTPEAGDLLMAYEWPGNVRELENAVERAVVLATGDTLTAEDLALEGMASPILGQHGDDEPEELEQVVRRHILRTLEKMDGNRARTAAALKIGRNTLWRKLKQYGVETP
ncbi:MAG: sigma-54-dependent transcriptional regulator [Armatimonadota bacterium]